MTKTTSGQAASKKRKWYLYDFLTFLVPSCSTGVTSGNLQLDDEDNAASSGDETSLNSPLTVQSDESSLPAENSLPHESSLPAFSSARAKKPSRCSKRKEQLTAIDREVLQALKEPEKEIDENELFFRSLLPAMKTLDLVQTLELRSEIQRLVLSHVKSAQTGRTAVEAPHARLATSPTSKHICYKCNVPSE